MLESFDKDYIKVKSRIKKNSLNVDNSNGLSTVEATKQLTKDISSTIGRHQKTCTQILRAFLTEEFQFCRFATFALLSHHLAILMLLLCLEQIALFAFEYNCQNELINRSKRVLDKLRRTNKLVNSDLNFPLSRATSMIRVRRDGNWQFLPSNIIVKGDVILLAKNENVSGITSNYSMNDGNCTVLESPIIKLLSSILSRKKKRALVSKQLYLFTEVYLNRLIAILCSLAGILAVFNFWRFEIQKSSIFFIFLATSPFKRLFYHFYSNGRLISLIRSLQISKTPFEEAVDVDEFDEEAPPPTKNIQISNLEIFTQIVTLVRKSDYLFWSQNLSDSFGTISVLAYLDREGPIAGSFPLPVEILFPSLVDKDVSFAEITLNSTHTSVIDTKFVNPLIMNEDLKALGLSLILTSQCGVMRGHFPTDWHLRINWSDFPENFKVDPNICSCPCSVSRQLGFYSNSFDKYTQPLPVDWKFEGEEARETAEIPLKSRTFQKFTGSLSQIIQNDETGDLEEFRLGSLSEIIKKCSYFWIAKEIVKMQAEFGKKVKSLDESCLSADVYCTGIAYKPIIMDRDSIKNPHSSQGPMIFLGAILTAYIPKDDMQELVDDLEKMSGIRFVYFSPYSESITKAFGDRLGLETDWNCCILLSSTGDDSVCMSEEKSKLPRGVDNIRPHLSNVDDIPLHISLFADCDAENTSEMLKIYHEYDETVICIGSALNHQNALAFSQSNTQILMTPSLECDRNDWQNVSIELASIGTPFTLTFDCSPYVITEIIREARGIFLNWMTCLAYVSPLVILMAVLTLAVNLKIPWQYYPIFLGTILSVLFERKSKDSSIMKKMPIYPMESGEVNGLVVYTFLKTLLNFPLFWACKDELHLSVCVFVCYSASGLHDQNPIWIAGPLQKVFWSLSAVCVVAISFYGSLTDALWWVTVGKILLFSSLASLLNEALKWRWTLKREQSEKRAKLLFNTKLGMHSPI